MEKYSAVLLCAGKGERSKLNYNKILYKIDGKKEIFRYSLDVFMSDEYCERIVIVSSESDYSFFKTLANEKISVTLGGTTRGESVMCGLKLVTSNIVLIHDAARPLLKLEDIRKLVLGVVKNDAIVLANPCFNTLCMINDSYIESYVDRSKSAMIVTPQGFKTELIKKAYDMAYMDNLSFTDDTSVYEKYIGKVLVQLTDTLSIKATTFSDIELLERILK